MFKLTQTLSITTYIALLLLNITHDLPVHLTQPNRNTTGVRVLLFSSSDKQDVFEKAATLSLDVSSERHTTRRPEGKINDSSLDYRQVSLASLTLHQPKHAREASFDQAQVSKQQDPWVELYLPKLKPTWLNASRKFTITENNISESDFFMPTEFMLRPAFDSPILLRTNLGILEGVRSIRFNKHIYTFLSIPYAKPPVGELRFKAPEPVDKWEGILQATKWPPFCVQPSMTLASRSSPVHVLTQIMTEDCLYMNIWTPSLKFNKGRKRPVMVWIHGGAFQYGGISVDENDGSALASLGDVVVVAMNYRVSVFGFLNADNPKNAPNNVGLLDQRLALEWVQANIKQFGGDPQQVTLFGESAGGHSVGLHMISPGSHQLFKRAILQSGVPTSLLRSYDVNPDNKGSAIGEGVGSILMAKRLNCYSELSNSSLLNGTEGTTTTTPPTTTPTSTTNHSTEESTPTTDDGSHDQYQEEPILNDATIECMREKSSLELLKAMGAPGNAGFFPTGNDANGFLPNGPIMSSFDPDNLKVGPQKDYLIGTNTDEGTFMLHYGMPSVFPARDVPKVSTIDDLKVLLKGEIERKMQQSAVSLNQSEIQSASGKQAEGAQSHLYRPLLRTSTSILEGFMPKTSETNRLNKSQEFGKNVASLITDIIFLCPSRSLARSLSETGRNVYFYLYNHRSSQSQYHNWFGVTHHDEVEFVFGRPLRLADVYSGADIEMSQRMIKIWSNFAYTGLPLNQFGMEWPKYGGEDNNYMILEPNKAFIGQRYHDKVCNIYDTVISVHLQDR